MGSIRTRPLASGKPAYLARYRAPDGSEGTQQFATKKDAAAWIRANEHAMGSGAWVDPERGKLTLAQYSPRSNASSSEERTRYRSLNVYATSKFANISLSRQLARRWSGTGVDTNAVHPGFVASSFGAARLWQVTEQLTGLA